MAGQEEGEEWIFPPEEPQEEISTLEQREDCVANILVLYCQPPNSPVTSYFAVIMFMRKDLSNLFFVRVIRPYVRLI